MLNHENAPWYTNQELDVLNAVAVELMAQHKDEAFARNAVHGAWFAGATVDQLRRAVAAHRASLPGEPTESDWQ